MQPEITLFSIIMILGAAHGLFLALALLNARAGSRTAHAFLALLTLAFAIDLGHEFLYQSRYLLDIMAINFISVTYIEPTINLLYGPAFYLYTCVLTEGEQFKLSWKRWLHFLPLIIATVACLLLPEIDQTQFVKLFYHDLPADTATENTILSVVGLIALLSVISIGLYLVLSIRRLVIHARLIRQEFSSIEKLTLNWLRNILIALSVLYLILMFDGFLARAFGFHEDINRLLYLMIVTVIYVMGYLGLRQPAIFTGKASPAFEDQTDNESESETKYKSSALDTDLSTALRNELEQHMASAKPYLQSKLTLHQLAEQLGISTNYLSQVINEQFKKNFFDFINDYRVAEAKQILADPARADLGIINIAYDAGFNSKSAFYTAFKKQLGMTPTQFRNAHATLQ